MVGEVEQLSADLQALIDRARTTLHDDIAVLNAIEERLQARIEVSRLFQRDFRHLIASVPATDNGDALRRLADDLAERVQWTQPA